MTELLSKFANVKVDAAARISPEDAECCEAEQANYQRAHTLYTNFRDELAKCLEIEKQSGDSHGEYCKEYSDGGLGDIDTAIKSIQEHFIHRIVDHFAGRYNVKIDSYKMIEDFGIIDYNKYHTSKEAHTKSTRKLYYTDILDEILLQLGGLTFADKAVQQIKDDAKAAVFNKYHGNIRYYTVNKKTIRFVEPFVHWNGNHHSVLLALWHFKTGMTSMRGSWWQSQFQKNHSYYSEDERVGTPYEFEDGHIRKMKYFKNGRWDITFASAELADKFAREYLGY